MLPTHPLLRRTLLYSPRFGTTFDDGALILRYGQHDPRVADGETDSVPGAERALTPDDSVATTLHEGIHWRQYAGTTVGAFRAWLKHSREIEVFEKLRDLPAARRQALLRDRRAGRPILDLDDSGLPNPPIDLSPPIDHVQMLRCVYFDNYLLDSLFNDSFRIDDTPAPFEQIFPSVIADAASGLGCYHPVWSKLEYQTILDAYRLDEEVRRVQVHNPLDRQGNNRPDEMTTTDVLEAGAVANELLIKAFTREQAFEIPDHDPVNLLMARGPAECDPGEFNALARRYLLSGHGVALREFFAQSGLDPGSVSAWMTAAVVADFALNPPLPPIVGPPERPLRWRDLYPPRRFQLAARACARLGALSREPDGAQVITFQDSLADAAALSPVPLVHPHNTGSGPPKGRFVVRGLVTPVPADRTGLPDFQAIKDLGLEHHLNACDISYYHFLLWSQVQLWNTRREDPRVLAVPGMLVPNLMWNDMRSVDQLMTQLAIAPPLMTDHRDDLIHVRGSSVKLGSWLATSLRVHGVVDDLMFGTGPMDALGMPADVVASTDVRELVTKTLVDLLGEDPYGDDGDASRDRSGQTVP